VEGTILTVMREWVRLLEENKHLRDIGLIFKKTLKGTKQSVEDTPKLLPVLKEEHVVDAGAEGFFHFLQGATKYLISGARELGHKEEEFHPELSASIHGGEYPVFRYCTEVLVRGSGLNLDTLRHDLASFGDCAIVAGGSAKARIHVHTDTPAAVVKKIATYGTVQEQKVDDMLREYEISHSRKYPIALVTDSVCDLPANLIDKYQIHVVPLNILVGDEQYFDGRTINNERIYEFMERKGSYPTTAQPGPAVFTKLYSYLSTYYESIIAIHVSGKLSGTYGASKLEAEKISGKRITVIDSRQDSGAQALVVLRAAGLIAAGKSHEEIVAAVEGFIPKARIFVSVPTLKYMVKGGRVSPLKGAIASVLNLKPIVSLDAEGGSVLYGKAFSTKRNLQKILDLVRDFIGDDQLRCYALVHADMLEEAKEFGRRLEDLTGRKPLFIQEISPIIALHAGKGTMAVVLMKE
jgi:DegV family protein with EDD domain